MKNTPDSITKFGCEANIKSMEGNELLVWCVGSLITYCSPNWEVMRSIFEPSFNALLLLQQRFDLTLKSPYNLDSFNLRISTSTLLLTSSSLLWSDKIMEWGPSCWYLVMTRLCKLPCFSQVVNNIKILVTK